MPTRRTVLGAIAGLPFASGCSAATKGSPAPIALAGHGGGPDAADNAPALRAALGALARRGGGVLEIGPGTHRIDAAGIGHGGIVLPANVTLRGAGTRETVLLVTGDAVCNLFVAVNRSGIAFEALTIAGNGAADPRGYGSGAAIRWVLDAAADADATGFAMRRVHLDNFGGAFWVDIENGARPERRLEMRAIVVDTVSFTSRPGNSVAPALVTHNSSMLCISGYSGAVRGVRVTGLDGDARHIKSGMILYHQVIDARLDDVAVRNAGLEGATDDAGAYAIQIYDPTGTMTSIAVDRPVITAPRSVGIYVAGGSDVSIREPSISGQTDRRAETLPKGAIVFNGTRRWSVTGGTLHDNWRDLAINPSEGGSPGRPVRIDGRVVGVHAKGSRDGVAIGYFANTIAAGIVFSRCRWQTVGRTVSVQNSPDAWIDGIVFEDCELEAGEGSRALDLWTGSGSPAGGYVLARCRLTGSNPLYARDQTGSLRIEGCTISDRGTDAGASAATLIGCTRLDLRDCVLRAPGRDGIGIDLAGATGAVRGLRFVACARTLPAAPVPVQLGRDSPRFAGQPGQYVQKHGVIAERSTLSLGSHEVGRQVVVPR